MALHRHCFSTTALPDLLGVDARAAQDDTLYRCHDLLLYYIISTCFECAVPTVEDDTRRFGHSRDRRGDCV